MRLPNEHEIEILHAASFGEDHVHEIKVVSALNSFRIEQLMQYINWLKRLDPLPKSEFDRPSGDSIRVASFGHVSSMTRAGT